MAAENILPQGIPLQAPSSDQQSLALMQDVADHMLPWMQLMANQSKALEDNSDENLANQDKTVSFLQKIADPIKQRYNKIKEKLMLKYEKIFVKGKWFEKVGKFLKAAAQKGSNIFFDLLKGLFMLSILGPGFASGIINMVVSMLVWAMQMVAKMLPKIVMTMIHIITKVLPPALMRVLSALFPALQQMFYTFAEELGKNSPVFKQILTWIGDLFSKDGFLYGALSFLISNLPILIGIWAALAIGFKAYMAAQAAYNVIMALNPIVLIVVAIIAAFAALWIWRDKIAEFFEGLFDWFSKLGVGFKILIVALAALFWPITLVVAAVYALVKLFQSFAKVGVGQTFLNIWQAIKDFFGNILDYIISFGVMLFDIITAPFTMLWKYYKWLWKNFKKFLKFVVKTGKTFIKFIGGLIGKLFDIITYPFRKLIDFFKNIGSMLKAGDLGKKIGTAIAASVKGMFKWIGGLGQRIGAVFEGIWNNFRGIISFLVSYLSELFGNIKEMTLGGAKGRANIAKRAEAKAIISTAKDTKGGLRNLSGALKKQGIIVDTMGLQKVLDGGNKALAQRIGDAISKMGRGKARRIVTTTGTRSSDSAGGKN